MAKTATYGTKTSEFSADYPGESGSFIAQTETHDSDDADTADGGDANQLQAEVRALGLRVGKDTDTDPTTLTGIIDINGFIRLHTSDDASAPNNSIYYSSDQSKAVYKDGGGVVNDLY
jgi:hypothetical protein